MSKHKRKEPASCARFVNGQSVQIPLGDSTYQYCTFVGTDIHGLSTVRTKGGRYKQVWDCNLYPHNASPSIPGGEPGDAPGDCSLFYVVHPDEQDLQLIAPHFATKKEAEQKRDEWNKAIDGHYVLEIKESSDTAHAKISGGIPYAESECSASQLKGVGQ